jgi:hypothetical protein
MAVKWAASTDSPWAGRRAARMAAHSDEMKADCSAAATDSWTVATKVDYSAEYLGYSKAARKAASTGANSVG